jgi:tetratricopeptide (TPR) repeat protein
MENNMAGKKKLKIRNSKLKTSKFSSFAPYVLGFALFVSSLLLSGCVPTTESEKIRTPQVDKIAITPAEANKLKLLKEIERRFENPEAHFQLGGLYQAEGKRVAAEYHYSTALRFDPVHRGAQAAMVKVMIENNDTAKAKLLADTYMRQVCESAEWTLELAQAFQKQELDDYALACYQQALRLRPDSAEVNKQVGYYYLSKQDKDRARDYLSRSFEIQPNQSDVALTLGQLGVEIRMPQKAGKSTKKPGKILE